jgi:hypothetical protein
MHSKQFVHIHGLDSIMHVNVHEYIIVCSSVRVFTSVCVCMPVWVCVLKCLCMLMCLCFHLRVYACVCAHVRVRFLSSVCVYVCMFESCDGNRRVIKIILCACLYIYMYI